MTSTSPGHRARGPVALFIVVPSLVTLLATAVFMLWGCPDGVDPLGDHESTAVLCSDGVDNDEDSLVDCHDPDCTAVCGGDGDGDGDGDSDSDADGGGDGDGDGDGDVDSDADADEAEECTDEGGCLLVLNFNLCCPCPEGMSRRVFERMSCVVEAAGAPARPDGCGLGCDPEMCVECPAASGVTCRDGTCAAVLEGDCQIDEDCGDGRLCIVEGSGTRCVDDPNECSNDDDCEAGWACRDWLETGVLFCLRPESTCPMEDLWCGYNSFCEDPGDDGVYECVTHEGECLVARPGDCKGDAPTCVDPDGDGRGTCA